jgi:dihydrofolate reductase
MGRVMFQMAVSLDGYVAGPDQSVENPVGVGGTRVFEWFFDLEVWRRTQGLEGGIVNASTGVIEDARANVGAYVMGRNMFGGGPGPWPDDPPWTGWWGDEPSYHVPVFVLTHYPRDPLEMRGGTTFFFVTDGIGSALDQARVEAADRDVRIAGGAEAVREYLRAGLVDDFELNLAAVLLGAGERLFDHVGDLQLEQVRAIEAPGVTHLKYRVVK